MSPDFHERCRPGVIVGKGRQQNTNFCGIILYYIATISPPEKSDISRVEYAIVHKLICTVLRCCLFYPALFYLNKKGRITLAPPLDPPLTPHLPP